MNYSELIAIAHAQDSRRADVRLDRAHRVSSSPDPARAARVPARILRTLRAAAGPATPEPCEHVAPAEGPGD